MNRFGLKIIVTCLLLSIAHGYARPNPRCDSYGYGQPPPASCAKLILDEIPSEGPAIRFFSLRTFIKPQGITRMQFSRRIALPYLRGNSRWSSRFKVCHDLLTIVLDACKVAFLAIRFLNGSVSYDTSSWENIRSEAQRLERSCGNFAAAPVGGNLVVGEFGMI